MLVNGDPGGFLSVDDRGLLYGDGLFETIAVRDGRPCLWQYHLERLQQSAERLYLPAPDGGTLRDEVARTIDTRTEGVIKIILTRGAAGRGYRPPKNSRPTRIVTFHDRPTARAAVATQGARLRLCTTRLGRNPRLAGLKTLNRLEQVLARAEWSDPAIDEGLMRDSEGNLIEGTMSNLFLLRDRRLLTPDLSASGIAGVMRRLVLALAPSVNLLPSVEKITLRDLRGADALFITNSVIGLWPVRALDDLDFDPRALPDALVEAVMEQGFGA